MLRLRTTTGLSMLALAIGIAGTGWLSTLTGDWQGPPARFAAARSPAPRALPSPRRSHASVRVVRTSRVLPDLVAAQGDAQASEPAASELVPLAMPGDISQSWEELRGHLDGRVLLHVGVDGNGRVSTASVSESSGDPVLDAHALRSVRGWRFAVPSDHPDGLSGILLMRFSSQGNRVAQLP
ncbi:energy transducer TonB [Rhodanobacter umsongensis]|uniref:Energy transducer TonB n=1 Tax=Rhodanobacter umsongensis TaxID=633153 RepID=A0ABW0JQY4_9GAMM